jgi:hypothetical protein
VVVPEVQQFGAAHSPRAGFENALHEQAHQLNHSASNDPSREAQS